MNDPNKSDPIKRKDFQLSDNDKEKLGGSVQEDTSHDTTANKLLSNIKQFNIDKSKYKHYGKQSSMNAHSLQKVMNLDKRDESHYNNSSHNESYDMSLEDHQENHIYDKLGLSKDEFFSLSNEIISELLKFKTEQEKTKQEEMRNEFASTALQILTLAKSMDFNADLIPYLFNNSSADVKKSLEFLSANSNINTHDFFSNFDSKKRSYSDTIKAEFIDKSTSTLVSPARSPPQRLSSPSSHRRNKSEDSGNATSNAESNIPSPTSVYPNYEVYSQQHSPNQVPQSYQGPPPGMYPVYYHPGPPPSHNHHQPTVNSNSHPQTPSEVAQANQSSNQSTNQQTKSPLLLGSPYQQKYTLPYPPPRGSYPPPGYFPQHYYLPSNQPNGKGQYNASMVPPFPPYSFIPTEPKDLLDEHISQKRQKTNISKNNINFMISTPKNPPARKYNNPKEK